MASKMVYDVLASFTCPRTITFQDYRLGWTHKSIVVCILAYVGFNLFSGQLYLVGSTPLGLVSVWSSEKYDGSLGKSSFTEARDGFYEDYTRKASGFGAGKPPQSAYRYCANLSYDYDYDVNYNYENIGCAFQEEAEIAMKGESLIFFTTMVQTNTVSFVGGDSGKCDRDVFVNAGVSAAECPDVDGTVFSHALGRCYCRSTTNAFVVAVENMTVSIEHKFEALYGRGELPRTFVRNEGTYFPITTFRASAID